jgi:hypothetical protein
MISRFLCLLAVIAPTLAGAQHVAPDGKRGLGAEATLEELRLPFRMPSDEDRIWLDGLRGLEGELDVLVDVAAGSYESRDYFDLVELLGPRVPPTVDNLELAFTEAMQDPAAVLGRRDRVAEALARMLPDLRFRARLRLLAGWKEDAREVRAGLMLLRATTDGWARLDEVLARNVAKRVDLAAAFLRTRVLDMEALREVPGDEPEARPEDLAELLALTKVRDAEVRERRLAPVLSRALADLGRLESLLFTTRLAVDADHLLRWRASKDDRAEVLLSDVRSLDPSTEESAKAPPDVKRMSKTRRRRAAIGKAYAGLAENPLDEALTLHVARLASYVGGVVEMIDYYDRYLALRGIRAHDSNTMKGRKLTDEESEALFEIQEYESGEGLVPPDQEE